MKILSSNVEIRLLINTFFAYLKKISKFLIYSKFLIVVSKLHKFFNRTRLIVSNVFLYFVLF